MIQHIANMFVGPYGPTLDRTWSKVKDFFCGETRANLHILTARPISLAIKFGTLKQRDQGSTPTVQPPAN